MRFGLGWHAAVLVGPHHSNILEQSGHTGAIDRVSMRSRHVTVTIDLSRIRASAEEILTRTRVPLIAVIKADAYSHPQFSRQLFMLT